MSYENNEYAYRILLEFDRELEEVPENLYTAFQVRAEEFEYVGGPRASVSYEVDGAFTPLAPTMTRDIPLKDKTGTGIHIETDLIQLRPLEVE